VSIRLTFPDFTKDWADADALNKTLRQQLKNQLRLRKLQMRFMAIILEIQKATFGMCG
jgi:hypothetical protein